jgi:hypothetical protein
MIVSLEELQRMKRLIYNCIAQGRRISASDCRENLLDFDATTSLFGQFLLRNIKRDTKRIDSYAIYRKIMSNINTENEGSDGSLLDLSNSMNIGSYKLAKLLLENALGKGTTVSTFVESPTLIENEWLRTNLLECIAKDPLCSLECDQQKECAGREYEELLISQLKSRGLCFETEAELRSRGKPKTPDILFLIPVGMSAVKSMEFRSPASKARKQATVINWIDSKAMFADEETFLENLEQLKSYVNRYGSGMVIYWHGYVETLEQHNDETIFIADRFPDELIYPTGEVANGGDAAFDYIF